jgi:hypothetical protein
MVGRSTNLILKSGLQAAPRRWPRMGLMVLPARCEHRPSKTTSSSRARRSWIAAHPTIVATSSWARLLVPIKIRSGESAPRASFCVRSQQFASLQIDEMQPGARRAGHNLVFGIWRIFVVILEGVLDSQAGIRASENECCHSSNHERLRSRARPRGNGSRSARRAAHDRRRTGSPQKKRSGQLRPLQVV